MAQSYRQFIISTLQLEPLDIAEKLLEQKRVIWREQQAVSNRMTRWLWAWVLSCSLLLATLAATLFNPVWVFWPVLLFSILAFVCALQVPVVKSKLHEYQSESSSFSRQRKLIAQAEAEIGRIRDRAIAYQNHLEPEDNPGFLAVFADIITHPGYVSAFSQQQRQRFVEFSLQGRAKMIDIVDYSNLLFELKNARFERYCNKHSLVEKVMPQNKVDVVLAYANLLGQKNQKADADDVRFAALIGLNALSMCQQQGLPAQWQNYEHRRWDMARQILQLGFQQKTLALIKLLPDFQQMQHKRSLKV